MCPFGIINDDDDDIRYAPIAENVPRSWLRTLNSFMVDTCINSIRNRNVVVSYFSLCGLQNCSTLFRYVDDGRPTPFSFYFRLSLIFSKIWITLFAINVGYSFIFIKADFSI